MQLPSCQFVSDFKIIGTNQINNIDGVPKTLPRDVCCIAVRQYMLLCLLWGLIEFIPEQLQYSLPKFICRIQSMHIDRSVPRTVDFVLAICESNFILISLTESMYVVSVSWRWANSDCVHFVFILVQLQKTASQPLASGSISPGGRLPSRSSLWLI